MTSALVYGNSEALRCADEQDKAKSQLVDAARLTNGLDQDLHKTWGTCAASMIRDIHCAVRKRVDVIGYMAELCKLQAEFCREADAAYQEADQHSARNLAGPESACVD